MPEGSTLRWRMPREMVLSGATLQEIDRWMDHNLKGDWYTGDLLRLLQKADRSNRHKLSVVYPDEYLIWSYWMHRTDMPRMSMAEETGALTE